VGLELRPPFGELAELIESDAALPMLRGVLGIQREEDVEVGHRFLQLPEAIETFAPALEERVGARVEVQRDAVGFGGVGVFAAGFMHFAQQGAKLEEGGTFLDLGADGGQRLVGPPFGGGLQDLAADDIEIELRPVELGGETAQADEQQDEKDTGLHARDHAARRSPGQGGQNMILPTIWLPATGPKMVTSRLSPMTKNDSGPSFNGPAFQGTSESV
jgi:hypothetical protein